jgi:TPR repeat protein
LGDRFFYGQGVIQDYEQAFFWYKKAADQGDKHAESRVGYCYKEGLGVDRDEEAAMQWYLKAAKKGDEDSLLAIELICQLQNKRVI